MPLKLSLKPGERFVLNGAVVENGDRRTVLVTGKGRVNLHENADGGAVVALADPGAIATLRACTRTACQVHSADVDGWIPKSRIWGVGAGEVFDRLPSRR